MIKAFLDILVGKEINKEYEITRYNSYIYCHPSYNILNEFAPIDEYISGYSGTTLFEYQDSIESAWLDTDPSDLSDFPDSLIANLGPVLEVMLSDEGEAKENTSIINLVDSIEGYVSAP